MLNNMTIKARMKLLPENDPTINQLEIKLLAFARCLNKLIDPVALYDGSRKKSGVIFA